MSPHTEPGVAGATRGSHGHGPPGGRRAPGDPAVIWSDEYLSYRLSDTHPMNPARLDLTMRLATDLGVLDGVETVSPAQPSDGELLRVHTPAYIAAVRNPHGRVEHGLGTDDNPVFEHMHEASAILAGGSLAAARAIASGSARRAVNIGGGMHHAMSDHAAGFCVYNDCAIAIAWLLDNGFDRVGYVDVDVHHGDGVQRAFIGDPRVLTVSIHQHPATLWPNTGWPAETGFGDAEGSAVNLAVLPGTADALWLRAFHAVVPGALRAFRPQIIVSQCGVDSHREDPLADLNLTVDGHRAAFRAIRDLADELCEGRWLSTGGGGYGVTRVVPRSWTHLLATVLDVDVPVDTPTPERWREAARAVAASASPELMLSAEAPETMGDGGDVDFEPWNGRSDPLPLSAVTQIDKAERDLARIDAAIADTRDNVFPLLGLDPDDPRD
ncbi:acetoin utilization protein AcuC [Tomitella fengzijianii]|uniref:Acetoin utilization protein AcuC n=1 Tax=Tomitella fengzijianii TaxID=2597660 RepID=A0A516X3M8_9ACTN|nr:acetoin utilization protein AcuC [Tomitella fengzijianii]QDQ97613.1 acetoin utilization protein AcuC [Tomitella fengzijianii]